MKSPFPGMDPYIEACGLWEGFHSRLIHRIDDALAKVLPGGYIIDTGVRTYVVVVGPEGRNESLAKPDVTVTRPVSETASRKKKSGTALAVVEADSFPMQAFIAEQFEESFVEIYTEQEDRVLVTCIEVLSPSNKRRGTEGWKEYERKRQALLLGRANFIEIDLLRTGEKMPMLTPWPDSTYSLLVSRAERAPRCRSWPAHIRRPLPPIPVPLLAPDPDLTLDLQPLIDGIYSLGRYHERIDYTRPLTPPLADDDAKWLAETLKNTPRRPAGRKSSRSGS